MDSKEDASIDPPFQPGDLVCLSNDNRVLWQIVNLQYSTWSERWTTEVTIFYQKNGIQVGHQYYCDDLRLCTSEEIAKGIAAKMLK